MSLSSFSLATTDSVVSRVCRVYCDADRKKPWYSWYSILVAFILEVEWVLQLLNRWGDQRRGVLFVNHRLSPPRVPWPDSILCEMSVDGVAISRWQSTSISSKMPTNDSIFDMISILPSPQIKIKLFLVSCH